jgi:DNA repair protein RadC
MADPEPAASAALPLDPAERPRERLVVHGPGALADVELVALVLGGGRALARAGRLLDDIGGLPGLAAASPQELGTVPGVGVASASALTAAVELGRRAGRLRLPWARPLRKPAEAAEYVRASLQGATQEHFLVLGLDSRQRVRLVRTVGVGSLAQVDVHPREVFRPLVRSGSHSAILAHNHPSGDPGPSEADIDLTRRLCDVGRLVGIPVLDHLIVTDVEYCSLASLGLLGGA